MDYAALLGALISVLGAGAGAALSAADKAKVLELLQASRDEFGRISVPKLKELTATLQQDTQLAGIKDDPQYRQQQIAADQGLNDIIRGGGLTLADQAALNAIRNKVSRSESAGRNAIAGQMAARGTLDSGAMLSMSLDNQQDAANRAAAEGEATAGRAQARAYEAILARSRMAGEGMDRDYRQKANAAQAQDAINRGNTDIRNLTARYNAGLPQQGFDNELRRASAGAGATANLANAYAGKAADTQNMWAAGSDAVGKGIQATFGEQAPQDAEWKAFQAWKKSQGGGI